MQMKFGNKFLLSGVLYVIVALVLLLILAYRWIPPGYAVVGHDSGLPLDAQEFLKTRFYAWDGRLDFGLDNSVNFGSLTIHFFDYLASVAAGVPYAGNFVSVFFWLGLIFVSAYFFAYQLKDVFGKPFVFILPLFLTFNFYIFQSVFMLERAKFGVFSASLISLGIYFRMQNKKISLVKAALVSALVFTVFNGGGFFGITLFGGAILFLGSILLLQFARGLAKHDFKEFKEALLFMLLGALFFAVFNIYAIVPYLTHFLEDNPSALFQEVVLRGNIEWARYVSRSASFLNLFRLDAVPDWYGEYKEANNANASHPYAALYLNNQALASLSFALPIFSFLGLFFAKRGKQRRTLAFFALIGLLGMFFAAGTHKPLGFIYELFMAKVPGFVLFRSAFYKFGIFYMVGMLVLFAFTLSSLITRLADFLPRQLSRVLVVVLVSLVLGSWLYYHRVLLDADKVFAWKADQTTLAKIPDYVFDFENWTKSVNLEGKRVLYLPPVNEDWKSDAYQWGYWSLSPLHYALSSINVLSHWHGLTSVEEELVDLLYNSIKDKDEGRFLDLAAKLNVGYLLIRHDALVDSNWSPSEKPENYKKSVDAFSKVEMLRQFGEWDIYKITDSKQMAVSTAEIMNFAPDKYLSIANDFFDQGRAVGSSVVKVYPELEKLGSKKMEVYDCISCPLERKPNLQSLAEVSVLPNSILYFFKEKRDQILLSVPKNPRDKMGDYLGIFSRRVSEQKRMIDLAVNEKYLIQNAVIIRQYLDKIHEILQGMPEKAQDFETTNQILEYIKPSQNMFSQYVTNRDFAYASRELTDNTLGVIWEIDRIMEFFSALVDNPEKWSNIKVYKIILEKDSDNYLYLPTGSYPLAKDGEIVLPEEVELVKDGKRQVLQVEMDKKGWLKARVESGLEGKAELYVKFAELPNVLTLSSPALEKFVYGNANCYQGSITNFDRDRAYEVRVWKTAALRPIKIIFSDKGFAYSEKHKFLQGEDSFEVSPDVAGGYARYVFFPSVSADNITLFICSDSQELPPLEKIEAREFFSPPVISITGKYKEPVNTNVDFERFNPTEYNIRVETTETPTVLVFNEKFDPSWKLVSLGEDGSQAKIDSHFSVDEYANAWLVDSKDGKNYKMYYAPQGVFKMSSAISAVSLLIAVSWLGVSSVRNRGKNEK